MMKSHYLRYIVIALLFAQLLFGVELFHFQFADANGKTAVTSGDFELKCRYVPLLVQNGALRIAATAEIEISGPFPDLRDGFSVSAWFLRKRDIDICPILSAGKYRDEQPFVMDAGPEFFTRRNDYSIKGIKKGNRIKLSGTWEHLVATYANGEYRIYRNGQLYDSASGEMPSYTGILYVGAEKEANAVMNYANADMLLNDLRFFDTAVAAADVAKIYADERGKYPEGSLIPPGNTVRHALELCLHYAPPGYDAELRNRIYPKKTVEGTPEAVQSSEIRRDGPRCAPELYINGHQFFPYMAYILCDIHHDRYEPKQAVKAAADFFGAGVKLIRIIAAGGGHPYSGWKWFGDGKYDFTDSDEKIRGILEENPHALIQVMLTPGLSPPWFRKQYPDELEVVIYPNGEKGRPLAGGLMNSDIWKRSVERYVQDAVEHLESGPYADRIFGYAVGGGGSSEWYWPGTFSGGIPGYSEATANNFRIWLREKYHGDNELQKSWRDTSVTLQTAQVPSPEERKHSETLFLRDPEKAAKVVDYRRFLNDRSFEQQKDLIDVVKKSSGGHKIVGTYSGYCFGNQEKHHVGGMNCAGRLLRLPECDYTQLAIVYADFRHAGESGLCVNPFNGSATLHGKMLWQEADLRTPYTLNTAPNETNNRHKTMQETADVIERNFGNALTRNNGIYEMPITGHATYHDRTIMDAVAHAQKMGENTLGTPRVSAAEIAVIHDEHSADYFAWPNAANSQFFSFLMPVFHYTAPRAGVPLDFYLMDDLADPLMPDYKVYLFLTAIEVSPEMRSAIHKKLERNNAAAVWFFTPGLIDGGRFSVSSMEKLTGIPFKLIQGPEKLKFKAEQGNSLLSNYDEIPEMNYGPIPVPDSTGQIVHATAAGRPAIVEVHQGARKTFYSLLPPNDKMLRGIATATGVHVYLDSSDIFNASRQHIMIHATTAGNKTIRLPAKYDVFDLYSGKQLFSAVSSFDIALRLHETRIFRINPSAQ